LELHYRVYEEIVNGGTPFEMGIQVDPRMGRKGNLCYAFDNEQFLNGTSAQCRLCSAIRI